MIDDEPVSAEVLAGIFGLHVRNVRKLAERGILARTKRDGYPLATSIKAYIGHLQETAAGRAHVNVGSGLAQQRERETRERADALAMKNAATRRELLPATEVEREWGDMLRLLRARLLALPSRIQQRLGHLTAHDLSTMDREIRDTLMELSDDPI